MSEFILKNMNTSIDSYGQLISLYAGNRELWFDKMDISIENWFAANLCSPLGGILDKLQRNANTILFSKITDKTQTILQKNGFLSHFGYENIYDNNNTTIRYLKLKPGDSRYFHQYIADSLLNRPELPIMTNILKKKIAESIYEIFVNAQLHSESEFIYTCGQFYPAKHKIEFTISDTGIGFRTKINRWSGKNLSAVQAIRWALKDGHSTKENISGGIGLAILRDFIIMNKGKLQIISNNGFFQEDELGSKTYLFNNDFPGTIINMQFKTDDPAVYAIMQEDNIVDLF